MNASESRSERGQVLVIVAAALLGLVAMVGLVIDGGYAWGEQRQTQNGADSVAMAGTIVVQHYLAQVDPIPNDAEVCAAVDAAALANDVDLDRAAYTDNEGDELADVCGGPIPDNAQGVKAETSKTFDTFLMGVVGINELTADADAIALVGQPQEICPATEGCGALPVTFPQTSFVCDDTNALMEIEVDTDGVWTPWEIIREGDPLSAANLATLPLCDINNGNDTVPGNVGWLDFGCGNIQQHIDNPCNVDIPIPAWVEAKTGNINSAEDELNDRAGPTVGVPEDEDQVFFVPIHDFTCTDDVADPLPVTSCPSYPDWSGLGDNTYFHIPFWVGFKLDQAYVQGGDNECEEAPGSPPLVGPSGKTGCLKGWFVQKYEAPGSVSTGPIDPGDPVPMLVVLVN